MNIYFYFYDKIEISVNADWNNQTKSGIDVVTFLNSTNNEHKSRGIYFFFNEKI
jgi:hypothetical protein